jgi:predicted glycosyltransferase
MSYVWFDALTPKHLRIAKYVESLAQSKGYRFVLTSRDYDELPSFSKILSLKPIYIGKHGGSNLREKLEASAERLLELYKTIANFDIKYVVCHGSPEATRIGFGLGLTTININDSPHAEAVARLTVPLTTKLISTDFIPEKIWYTFGLKKGSLIKYHGIESVTWIKREKILQKEIPLERPIVLFRPEEIKASYIEAQTSSSYLTPVLKQAQKQLKFSLVVLPRYKNQYRALKEELPDALVLDQQEEGLSLIASSDVFIGAGGTMTWEAALLGKPTLSAFPHFLYVEKALRNMGILHHVTKSNVISKLRYILNNLERIAPTQSKLAKNILQGLEDPLDALSAIIS